jgi:uncharacterized membrane protein YedE/YeeE
MNAWFADPSTLLLGALAGLVFGFLLQKGGVTSYSVIVNQFRLLDHTVAKVMLTAIVVGGLGIYGMRAVGMDVALHIKGTEVLGNALGGLIFGVGMVVLGYCPGTGVAAIGSGSRHAIFGVLGMLFGAGVYAEFYPWINEHILGVGAIGKVSLSDQLGVSPFVLLVPLAIASAVILPRLPSKRAPMPAH